VRPLEEDGNPGRTEDWIASLARRKGNRRELYAMTKALTVLTAAAVLAAVATPAPADGVRRAWRGSGYAVGAISRDVITPYYYGYYGSHYSYFAPDPVYNGYYAKRCWLWGYGYPYRVC
jgi:hypothetical protein